MRNSAKLLLRALIVSGAVVATMGAPMAHADGPDHRGGDTGISNINNGNAYVYQGLGVITLDNLLGTGALLPPLGSLPGRLTP